MSSGEGRGMGRERRRKSSCCFFFSFFFTVVAGKGRWAVCFLRPGAVRAPLRQHRRHGNRLKRPQVRNLGLHRGAHVPCVDACLLILPLRLHLVVLRVRVPHLRLRQRLLRRQRPVRRRLRAHPGLLLLCQLRHVQLLRHLRLLHLPDGLLSLQVARLLQLSELVLRALQRGAAAREVLRVRDHLLLRALRLQLVLPLDRQRRAVVRLRLRGPVPVHLDLDGRIAEVCVGDACGAVGGHEAVLGGAQLVVGHHRLVARLRRRALRHPLRQPRALDVRDGVRAVQRLHRRQRVHVGVEVRRGDHLHAPRRVLPHDRLPLALGGVDQLAAVLVNVHRRLADRRVRVAEERLRAHPRRGAAAELLPRRLRRLARLRHGVARRGQRLRGRAVRVVRQVHLRLALRGGGGQARHARLLAQPLRVHLDQVALRA
eukprot:Rhum_TRINITY_DN14311_c22_g1::Rhum_TRINITY_DN14311_c22_g1_i1::g.83474::m.83474